MKLKIFLILLHFFSFFESSHKSNHQKYRRKYNQTQSVKNRKNHNINTNSKKTQRYTKRQKHQIKQSSHHENKNRLQKRKLNDLQQEIKELAGKTSVQAGSAVLALGGIDQMYQNQKTQHLHKLAENQYMLKQTVIELLQKDIDNLVQTNIQLHKQSRQLSQMNQEMMTSLQHEILATFGNEKQ